jgi:hypothetical protein
LEEVKEGEPMSDDQLWRNLVNSIPDTPTEGLSAPAMENFDKKPLQDGESPVTLQKIITEVYVYTSSNIEELWFGSQTFQDVQVLGKMRLSEALKTIETAKNRRRRRK